MRSPVCSITPRKHPLETDDIPQTKKNSVRSELLVENRNSGIAIPWPHDGDAGDARMAVTVMVHCSETSVRRRPWTHEVIQFRPETECGCIHLESASNPTTRKVDDQFSQACARLGFRRDYGAMGIAAGQRLRVEVRDINSADLARCNQMSIFIGHVCAEPDFKSVLTAF